MQPDRKSRRVGRPPLPMPDPIPDTPENVIDAVLSTPPRKRDEWKFMQRKQPGSESRQAAASNREGS